MTTVRAVRGPDRAAQILAASRDIFLARGWDGFSIERIADRVGCSRPLIYRHFPSKEEILLSLAIESKHRRVGLYEHAIMFQGRPREKMLALGEVETFLFERDLPVELFVASTNIRAKTSPARQEELRVLDVRAISMGAAIVREAVSAGDLQLPARLGPEDLLFSLWAARWGASNIRRSDTPLSTAGIAHPAAAIEHSLMYLLDGYGWRPLSTEHDYLATRRRVHAEAFPNAVVKTILGE